MVAQTLAARLSAKQTVQGTRFGRESLTLGVGQRELLQRTAQRLGEARGGFTGWGGQPDTALLLSRHLDQRRQQAGDGGGFTGARSAGNHRNAPR